MLSRAVRSQISKRTGVEYTQSLDKWYEAFKRRAESVHGIKLKEAATRKQSAGRAALSQETIEDFTSAVVRELLIEDQCSMLTLNSIGNADEWWFDANKLMHDSLREPLHDSLREPRLKDPDSDSEPELADDSASEDGSETGHPELDSDSDSDAE